MSKRGSSSREWVERPDSDDRPKQPRPWGEGASRNNWADTAALSWWDKESDDDEGLVNRTPTKAEAEVALIEFVTGNFVRGKEKWTAEDVCVVSYWAAIIGDTQLAKNKKDPSLKALAKAPGDKSTNHYSRVVKRVMGMDTEDFLELKVPGVVSSDASNRSELLAPVRSPHEVLHKEITANPELRASHATMVEQGQMPEAYMTNPIAIASNYTALIYHLYIDAVPTVRRDGVLGIWVKLLNSSERHICCVMRKSKMCRCSCRKWCTLYCLFTCLAWSFAALAEKSFPATAPDGSAWGPSEENRDALGGFLSEDARAFHNDFCPCANPWFSYAIC